MVKRLKVVKDIGYGIFRMDDGRQYVFDYGTSKDIGFGELFLDEVNATDSYSVLDVEKDDNDNLTSVIIK
ncbi:MAG: hypothetical protein GX905_08245 [Bacteroidales bacterium]|jgi:hypothetical protein|nr:hypothetical protein [Bacteroidales bacterium]